MVLVGFVQQVVGSDVELSQLLAMPLDVGASRQVKQGIARCGRLSIVDTIDVVLPQIAVKPSSDVEVVEQ